MWEVHDPCMLNAPTAPTLLNEKHYAPVELSARTGWHRTTITRLFIDEPGVIRMGHGPTRKKHQHYTLLIPESVVQRVFARMTVGNEGRRS